MISKSHLSKRLRYVSKVYLLFVFSRFLPLRRLLGICSAAVRGVYISDTLIRHFPKIVMVVDPNIFQAIGIIIT